MTCSGKQTNLRNAGQTLIFLIMVLVTLTFIVLWNFDLHKILYVKSVTQNAGDSAALVASRWQGITLNLVGDLNLMHALALGYGPPSAESAITNVQARLCYVGPMVAFIASQQAAKNNGIFVNPDFTDYLKQHANRVRNDYPNQTGPGGTMLFPEPYPGCWQDYADMLDLIAADGLAAGPDNMRLYGDSFDGHILLMVDFYEAVAGNIWCWFYRNFPTLLGDYQNFFPCWWPPLPDTANEAFINSEFFGLGLACIPTVLAGLADLGNLTPAAQERGLPPPSAAYALPQVANWYVYASSSWTDWQAMSTSGEDPFPSTGPVKPQYDYAGADAAIRIETDSQRITPGPKGATATNHLTWTAAAKPFGYLGGGNPIPPNSFNLVLPAFREVRLIPVDASSAPAAGGYNLAWRKHVDKHLPAYMTQGPSLNNCWYCTQLVKWESTSFRQQGITWLESNSGLCDTGQGPGGPGGGGGGGGGGGRRRGH